jgi:L-ribulose-5-phosphate 4-epimerase
MRRSATWSSAFEAKWRTCMTISPELAGGLDRGQCVGACAGRKLLVIKPSGVRYDDLSPANMVVTDLEAHLVEGDHAPSSDTAAHAYVYQHMPDVGGVVHTHSTYATAWAARGEPIPCVLTMIADEFGGEIPVGPFALIG